MTFIKPFSIPTWLFVMITFFVSIGTYFSIAQMGKTGPKEEEDDLSIMITVHGLLLQGTPFEPSKTSLRIAFLTIFLAGLMLYACYSSCLMSFLAVKVLKLPFTDESTLLNSDYKIVTVPGITSDHFKVAYLICFTNELSKCDLNYLAGE